MFSMKLRSHVWSEPLDLRVRIRWEKGRVAVCKAERRVFLDAQRLTSEVVPRLQVFMGDMLADRNYVGEDIRTIPVSFVALADVVFPETDFVDVGDLRRELRFREYVVFPCNCGRSPKFVAVRINVVGTLEEQLDRRPEEVIRKAVKGMIPKNRLGDRLLTKLKVYRGSAHPHSAQQPAPLTLSN